MHQDILSLLYLTIQCDNSIFINKSYFTFYLFAIRRLKRKKRCTNVSWGAIYPCCREQRNVICFSTEINLHPNYVLITGSIEPYVFCHLMPDSNRCKTRSIPQKNVSLRLQYNEVKLYLYQSSI